ncbi:lipoprotein heptaprenylglyceryl N-acetyltransferase LhaT [Salinibacillus xinjiangensis]|uniref:DUF1405 domain-containing protein n=1 Tax=Salinibacillus xinjiangensis TaxID=1229268 RepID=A0A6G1X6E5_9BACI|nr:DUF1405 domain-containing protein [Salinibacillus xinjiangensis]MRG86388.1 DUF1405 domain-containing protein [Salinibacillus xinjiangensis]
MFKILLMDKRILVLLFVINLLGTIYGYLWYGSQLSVTPAKFLIFVPDSPTASLFFVIVLLYFILDKNAPYIEALAFITLVKYGVWAVIMNILTMQISGGLSMAGYMLIFSHGAMAIQAMIYAPFYKIKLRHLAVAAIWTLHNDVIDYVFEMMPVYGQLMDYMNEIGYFTFWLSIFCIGLVYAFNVRKTIQIR